MPRLKLTSAAIEKLKCSKEKRQEFFDALLPGLALRITKRGSKSWVLFYRPKGKLTRLTLGRYPVLTLSEAREKARLALQGQLTRRYLQPETPTPSSPALTAPQRLFKDAFAEYIERYAKVHNKSWRDKELLAKHRLSPTLGDKDIAKIKKTDIITLIDGIIDDGAPVQAHLAFAYLRKFFNWCVERAYLEQSPCNGLKSRVKLKSRERVLTDDELKKVWAAFDQLSEPIGDFFKVLLLTGQRRSEVAGMRWCEIDGDVWTLPADRSKNGCKHSIPLVPSIRSFIDKYKNFDLVFTTTGDTPISGFSKVKKQIDETAGVTGWCIHDLRRTAATGMAKLKIPPHVVEKVLNHKSGEIRGVAAVYNRHAYIEECKEALDKWAEYLSDLTSCS